MALQPSQGHVHESVKGRKCSRAWRLHHSAEHVLERRRLQMLFRICNKLVPQLWRVLNRSKERDLKDSGSQWF